MQFFNEPLMHDKMGPIQFLHHEIDSRLGHITSKLMNHISNWDIHMTADEKSALEKLSESIDEEGQIIVDPSSLFGKFATIDQIPTKVSQLVNDRGFITEIPNYYVTEEELNLILENIPVSKYTDYDYINNQISNTYNQVTNEYKAYTDNAIIESSISEETIRQIIANYITEHGLSVSWESVLNKPVWAQGAELPKASRSAFGTVKIGNGIDVQDGVISVTGQSYDTNDVIVVCFHSADTEISSDYEFGDDYPAYNFTTHTPLLPGSAWSFKPDFSKNYVYMLKKTCVKGENNYWGNDWTLIYSKDQSSGSFDDNFAIHNGADGNVYMYSKKSVTSNTDWTTFTWLARNYGTLYEAYYNQQAPQPWRLAYEEFYGNVAPELLFQPSFCLNLTTGAINTRVNNDVLSSEIFGQYINCNTIVAKNNFATKDLDGHYLVGRTTTITLQNATRNYSANDYDVELTGTVELKFVNGLLIGETWKSGGTAGITPTGGGSGTGSGTGGGGGGSRVNTTSDDDFIPHDGTFDPATGRSTINYEINQINELYGKGTTFNEDNNP